MTTTTELWITLRKQLPSQEQITNWDNDKLISVWKLAEHALENQEYRTVTDDSGYTVQDDYYTDLYNEMQERQLPINF